MNRYNPTSGKRIKAPKLPRHEMEKGLPAGHIEGHSYYAQLLIAHDDFTEQEAEHASFDQILFQQVLLSKTRLRGVQILDSRLTVCDLANAEWPEATLSRVELFGCHLTGLQCSEARFQDVLFKECRGSFSQFAFSSFKAVRFENCDLSETNFLDADLTGTSFVNCDLRNADLTGTKLVGVDLRTCTIDGARVGPRELQGAILNPEQALGFVRSMGITVAALDEKATAER